MRGDYMEVDKKVKEIRDKTGLDRKYFADYFKIPLRTIEDWEAARRRPPEYVVRLLAYKVAMDRLSMPKNMNSRNVHIIEDEEGKKIVLINDKCFKGLDKKDWKDVEVYLTRYVGECYEIMESSEIIYIDKDFPDEFANSKERISLRGANRKAKANISQGIPELIQIASKPRWEANKEEKHKNDAKFGWFRYLVRFALPIYDDKSGELIRYNIFMAKMLIRHAEDGKKYLYDILAIKKENEKPA